MIILLDFSGASIKNPYIHHHRIRMSCDTVGSQVHTRLHRLSLLPAPDRTPAKILASEDIHQEGTV